MSNDVNTQIKERVVDVITNEWVLPQRDDLLEDCIEFVTEEALTTDGVVNYTFMLQAMIEFLSKQAVDTLSTRDINDMAKEMEVA
jgi:hypothetical protein